MSLFAIEFQRNIHFDRIDGSATIGRADGTFGFSLIQYPNFDLFKENALTEIERIQSTTGIFTRTFENDNPLFGNTWINLLYRMLEVILFLIAAPKSFGKMTA
jgi:chloramphenicol O-acetyltransferase type A